MTLAELIAVLSNFPPTTHVLVDGYEGGFDDVSAPVLVPIRANANLEADYFGAHLIDDDAPTEVAVWIKSVNSRGDRLNVDDMQRLKITGWW